MSDIKLIKDELNRLRAENERLRAALKPFAEAAAKLDVPNCYRYHDIDSVGVLVGHCRAAKAVLEGKRGG